MRMCYFCAVLDEMSPRGDGRDQIPEFMMEPQNKGKLHNIEHLTEFSSELVILLKTFFNQHYPI